MILFFNNQKVTEKVKIKQAVETVQLLYASDFYDVQNQYWFGDNLSVEALFPNWIIKEYENNPNNVFIVPIVKNYFRWLFSLEFGYGAQLNWENIRDPTKVNSIFLESFCNFYFPNANFENEPLKSILPNIRRFLINAETDYTQQKGTPKAIKYLMTNFLGFEPHNIDVYTSNASVMRVSVSSSRESDLNLFKPFLEEHVFPAGISIIYEVM